MIEAVTYNTFFFFLTTRSDRRYALHICMYFRYMNNQKCLYYIWVNNIHTSALYTYTCAEARSSLEVDFTPSKPLHLTEPRSAGWSTGQAACTQLDVHHHEGSSWRVWARLPARPRHTRGVSGRLSNCMQHQEEQPGHGSHGTGADLLAARSTRGQSEQDAHCSR